MHIIIWTFFELIGEEFYKHQKRKEVLQIEGEGKQEGLRTEAGFHSSAYGLP